MTLDTFEKKNFIVILILLLVVLLDVVVVIDIVVVVVILIIIQGWVQEEGPRENPRSLSNSEAEKFEKWKKL